MGHITSTKQDCFMMATSPRLIARYSDAITSLLKVGRLPAAKTRTAIHVALNTMKNNCDASYSVESEGNTTDMRRNTAVLLLVCPLAATVVRAQSKPSGLTDLRHQR
jgi:hypothetical protein